MEVARSGGAHVTSPRIGHAMMPLTPDQRADILDSLRAGCSLDVAAKASRTTAAACRELAATDAEWKAQMDAAVPAEPVLTLRQLASMQVEPVSERAPVPYDPQTGEVYVAPDDDNPELERLAGIAASYGAGPFGYLQMVNARCEAAGQGAREALGDDAGRTRRHRRRMVEIDGGKGPVAEGSQGSNPVGAVPRVAARTRRRAQDEASEDRQAALRAARVRGDPRARADGSDDRPVRRGAVPDRVGRLGAGPCVT